MSTLDGCSTDVRTCTGLWVHWMDLVQVYILMYTYTDAWMPQSAIRSAFIDTGQHNYNLCIDALMTVTTNLSISLIEVLNATIAKYSETSL